MYMLMLSHTYLKLPLPQAFAWLGFAVSIVWIYSIANEIVNLLQVFGIVMKLSDGILGITLLAWGNSIGGVCLCVCVCVSVCVGGGGY